MLGNKQAVFLKHSIMLMVFGCLLMASIAGSMAAKSPVSAADYEALKGENFTVIRVGKGSQAWSKSVNLKLIEIKKSGTEGLTEQFSLRFQGPRNFPLDKAVHQFNQAKTGQFSLFLEPRGIDAKGRYYEAFFNLLKHN